MKRSESIAPDVVTEWDDEDTVPLRPVKLACDFLCGRAATVHEDDGTPTGLALCDRCAACVN